MKKIIRKILEKCGYIKASGRQNGVTFIRYGEYGYLIIDKDGNIYDIQDGRRPLFSAKTTPPKGELFFDATSIPAVMELLNKWIDDRKLHPRKISPCDATRIGNGVGYVTEIINLRKIGKADAMEAHIRIMPDCPLKIHDFVQIEL